MFERGARAAEPAADAVAAATVRTWQDRLEKDALGGLAYGTVGSAAKGATTRDAAACLELIESLESLKRGAAAVQARLAVELDRIRRGEHAAAGLPANQRGRGVAAEVALARQESAHAGGRLLGLAKALLIEMPHTYRELAAGRLSEWRATILVRESACLEVEQRGELDRRLCGRPGALLGKGDRQIAAEAKRVAYRLDGESVARRAAQARADRRVTLRPAADTMCYLTALLPVAEGVASYAALMKAADQVRATGDERSRGQVMADALVERVTGHAADAVPVHVNLVMSDASLLRGSDEPAVVPGYGPIAAAHARGLVAERAARSAGAGAGAGTGPHGETTRWLRRLYLDPAGRALVAMDSRLREVPPGLAELIAIRDAGSCRMPWCDAPLRHNDHVVGHAAGGPTEATNLQGLCEAHNYAKQAPGWAARPVPADVHTVRTRTPSGTSYDSVAPAPPGARSHPRDGDDRSAGATGSNGSNRASRPRRRRREPAVTGTAARPPP